MIKLDDMKLLRLKIKFYESIETKIIFFSINNYSPIATKNTYLMHPSHGMKFN